MPQRSNQIQSQTQQQVQTLSPQQILTVRLLELPELELEDRIRAELLENPALEEGKEDEEKAKSIMATLGIERLWNEAIDKISGGERELVFFSRAVFQDSMFIILDEPTANLDYMNQIMILSRIETLKRQGKGIIFSTHNPEEALQNADEILILDKGKIAFSGSADECIEKNALETLFEGKITVRKIAVDGKERFICIPT